jgi:hypothetical protein
MAVVGKSQMWGTMKENQQFTGRRAYNIGMGTIPPFFMIYRYMVYNSPTH